MIKLKEIKKALDIVAQHLNLLWEVHMMAQINLSIDDDLFDLLKDDADGHNCTVNVYLVRRELFGRWGDWDWRREQENQ